MKNDPGHDPGALGPLSPALPRDLGTLARRDRILDGLAATVAEKSLAATTIADIVASAGVSRATFYKHFPDKRACFIAAVDAYVTELVAAARGAQAEHEPPADSIQKACNAVLELLAEKPDYTRLVLAEATAVEPDLIVTYRDALMDALLKRWVPDGVTPHTDRRARSAFGRAQVLVWDHVASGRGGQLPELMPEIVYAALLQTDRDGEPEEDPAVPLHVVAEPAPNGSSPATPDLRQWRLPRGRHGLPRELVEQSQRERLLAAIVRVVAAKGYEDTSVADVLKEAGVGRESFYELFADKQDCFLAAHSMLVDDLLAKVTDAYGQPGPWPEQVRRGLGTLLEWFAADPDVARVTMVELAAVGPTSGGRFRTNFHRFTSLLDEGRPQAERSDEEMPNISAIAAGAVFARVFEEIVVGRAAQLPQLLPRLTFEVLLPFLGSRAARAEERRAIKEASGEGARREREWEAELPTAPSSSYKP